MITIKFDQQFQIDFKRISRRIPQIVTELEYVIEAIEEYGRVPESYNPHMLDRPRGIYSGYAEFHLAEGKMDVLVIYSERSERRQSDSFAWDPTTNCLTVRCFR